MLDDTDRRIIAALRDNARSSTTAIAARLGLARTTVHERIARLEDRGVINGYTVVLRERPEENRVQVVVLLEVRQQDTARIIRRIETRPEVRLCLSVNGEYDLLLSAEAPKIEELDRLVDELAAIPGVLRTNTFVVFSKKIDR